MFSTEFLIKALNNIKFKQTKKDIAELRKKFEEDKKRIDQMKQNRKFKPNLKFLPLVLYPINSLKLFKISFASLKSCKRINNNSL